MGHRPGTNDWNTLNACMTEDEYRLAGVALGAGAAVDVGSYLGGVAIGLALDHPEARVWAVEPLPANVELLRENVERAGVADRLTVVPRAAARPGVRTTTIRWAFDDTESGRHHRYVGNSTLGAHATALEERVGCVSLSGLVALAGGRIDLLKVDTEGAEYELLADAAALAHVGLIVGEYHAGYDRLAALLAATHAVERLSGSDLLGEFRAVPR